MQHTANVLTGKPVRGFESLPLRSMGTLLLWGGVVGGPFFIVVFLVEGWLRPNYNPMRQPVSALSIGPRGWVQEANFFINGAFVLACAIGLPSALQSYGGSFWAPLLVGVYAIGTLGAGVFVTDVRGSHEGGSIAQKRTTSAILHDIFSAFVFVSLCAACFVFAHLFAGVGAYGWETYSIVSGVLYGCGFILFARGFSPTGKLAPIAGSLQRLTISIGAIWLALVALHLLGII